MITLPDYPGPSLHKITPRDFGGNQEGPLGGTTQRVNRLGKRWRCEVQLPTMTPAVAREWAVDLERGLDEGVSWRIRQVSTPTGSPGAVLVNGADQAGDELIVDGGTPGYVAKKGAFFSLTTGGRSYLYKMAQSVQLSGTGAGTLLIEPRLRRIPANNDPINFGSPVITGLLSLPPGLEIDAGRLVRGFAFSIEEVA
jgi:hypothetical protein